MEVVYVENTDPFVNYVGGIPTYIRNASYYLKTQNIKSHLVGSILNTKLDDSSSFEKVISLSDKKIGHFKFLIKLFKNINRLKFESNYVIHSQRIILCLPFVLFSKNRIICTSHGIEGETFTRRRGKIAGIIYYLIEGIVIPRLSLIMVVDPRAERYFQTRYPKYAHKVQRIPIGIDYEIFKPLDKELCRRKFQFPMDKKIILFLGRIEYQKNLKLLLDAFKLVNADIQNTLLIIAGDGKLLREFKEYCKTENIEDVRFIGGVDFKLTPELLNTADLLALSSHFEGSPTVVKESLACNVPVVSTDCGDVKDVICGLEKCYISKSEANDLANKMCESLNDPKIYNYRDRLGHYSNDKLFEKLTTLYLSL